jgi:hypothetical protein
MLFHAFRGVGMQANILFARNTDRRLLSEPSLNEANKKKVALDRMSECRGDHGWPRATELSA